MIVRQYEKANLISLERVYGLKTIPVFPHCRMITAGH
jgi:hypothetical protein